MQLMDKLESFLYHLMFLMGFLISLPPYLLYKLFSSIIKPFRVENVAGKVVLITGASSGIGEHLAYEYAKRRAKLVLVARRENLLKQVAQRARDLGSPDVIITCADVSKADHCKRFIEETINQFGQLDHLVNNAGTISVSFFEESTNIANLAPVMDVNFWGAVYTTQFAIPHLKKTKGKIIVNASVAGWFSPPTTSIYNASKAALISFYETLGVELHSRIGITIVSLSFTDSEMTGGKQISMEGTVEVNKKKLAEFMGKTRIRSAQEVAKVIVNGVCLGKKHITDPSWARLLFFWKVFFPDVVERVLYFLHVSGRAASDKIITNENGAKKLT